MWKVVSLILPLVMLCAQGASGKEEQEAQHVGHVSVVIVGGTGDLAKKYLWQGFFQLYINEVSSGYTFSFYGGGLSPEAKATPALFEILKGVSCPEDVPVEQCALLKEQFLRLSKYWQLKTTEEYLALAKHIDQELKEEGMKEAGRLFYLSVPAFAYADVADKINSSCRPVSGAWLRVVFEKPFGHDFGSAQTLSTQLRNSLKEEEMYRIDHYLGKQVVSKILPFRKENKKFLDPIWNTHHIERVEIVLKETLDVKGRIPFYDQYGAIRDVLQNHLTEVMTLLTMRVPQNLSGSEVLQNKLQIFSSLYPLGRHQAVIGQYQAYNAEVQKELNKTKDYHSFTPTFAAVIAHIDMAQYDGLPIIVTSGKMLDERVGYARVLFKNDVFCIQNSDNIHCKRKQIVFYFGHGSLQHPAILVTKNLFKPSLIDSDWKEVTQHKDVDILGLPVSDYYIQAPKVERDAYAELISQFFAGRKDSFISTENLLASWGLWTPLLDSLAQSYPRIYPGGVDNGNLLDFHLKGKELKYASEAVVMIMPDKLQGSTTDNYHVMQGKFRSADMVSAWAEELVEQLAVDLQAAAEAALNEGGVFHLALSGGSSPLALFQRLAQHHFSFPWRDTHLWMVDERCVPLTEQESNFHNLHNLLLQRIRIPYYNIHPMPVQLNQRLCVEEDGGALLYEKEITQLVNGSSFHFVILGVGYDGHTASLFPGGKVDGHADSLVVLTESTIKPHQRMSLTLKAINRAHNVALLVMGKGKHEVITQLSRVKDDLNKWPVTGVHPTNGRLVWYIDYDALLG
ncbi:GDH/6PGL endoplasmic bifunctional protein [Lampris incognitus]|uniref:GDH/6PGL endoplasmic bifunctional protein n=1 Tax=Lampris incognitus TaxID=2546036 RepID=UPI0024B5F87B|nr:GDH/6PGL endoplasmic bifunctional protein [Lampris incognitus]